MVETARSEAVAAGLEVGESLGAVGLLRLVALVGWDGGAGGEGGLSLVGDGYAAGVRAWRARARQSTVFLPADSLRDVGVRELATGLETAAHAELPLGGVTFVPRVAWTLEQLHDEDPAEVTEGFLRTSPAGETRSRELALGLGSGLWSVEGSLLSRTVDLQGRLYRSGASAGRLFYTTFELRRWTLRARHRSDAAYWSLTLARETLEGGLAVRVETWPFGELWSTLAVQAYRLQGLLGARATWAALRRASGGPTGWTWGASIGRYDADVGRDSWFVTSFGFGRTDRVTSRSGVDPAVVVGAEVARDFGVGQGFVRIEVEAALPVHARETGPAAPSPGTGEDDLAGYATVAVRWAR